MGEILKTALILTLVTLIAGIGLGLIYAMVKKPIEKAELNAKLKAIREVLIDPESGKLMVDDSELPKSLSELENKIWRSDESGIVCNCRKFKAKVYSPVYRFKGLNGEEIFILTGSSPGYGGDVVVMASFVKKADGMFENAIEILDYSQETPGLGARISESEVKKRFYGVPFSAFKKSEGLKVNKDAGVMPKDKREEIEKLKRDGVIQTSDIMTGATITPRAVVNTLNCMFEWLGKVEGVK
ncbi:MAG: electron transporter RnfG [Thermotoga sp.]|nr:MAG: electron transporter RnfG [Thermotoga sp.]